jgi:hypothetical protein
MLVSSKVFDDHEAEPLVESMSVIVENKDHVTKQFPGVLGFVH